MIDQMFGQIIFHNSYEGGTLGIFYRNVYRKLYTNV